MKLVKTKPAFTFAMICADRSAKAAFKAEAGIKGRKWFASEGARDAEMQRLSELAEKHSVALVPEYSDISLA